MLTIVATFMSVALLGFTEQCVADSPFAIGQNGRLYSLDFGAAGSIKGTVIRQLSSDYRWIDGLVLSNGYFYSSYAPNGDSTQTRRIVKFGVGTGTEVDIGSTGYSHIGDLAINSSGTVYASVATSSTGNNYKLGTVDLTTGQISNVVSTTSVASCSGSNNDIRAMTFGNDGNLYAMFSACNNYYVGTFNPTTGALGTTYVISRDTSPYHPYVYLWGMGTDPSTGVIHGVQQYGSLWYLTGLTTNPWTPEGNVFRVTPYDLYPDGHTYYDYISGLTYGAPSPGFTPSPTPTMPAGTPSPTVTPADSQIVQPAINVVINPTPTATPTP